MRVCVHACVRVRVCICVCVRVQNPRRRYRNMVVNIPSDRKCRTLECTYRAEMDMDGRQRSSCCMRCHDTSGQAHGRNCTANYVGAALIPTTVVSVPGAACREWFDAQGLPVAYSNAVQALAWYFSEYQMTVPLEVLGSWQRCLWLVAACDWTRVLTLHVYGANVHTPAIAETLCIDARGCNARFPSLDPRHATGCDWRLQAVVASRSGAPDVIRRLCLLVETHPNEDEFGIFCNFGVHRSMAASELARQIAYPRARFRIYSARTREAALRHGLPT